MAATNQTQLGAEGQAIARVRTREHVRSLVEYLERHEPWSTAPLSHLLSDGNVPWRTKSWLVKRSDGEIIAAVVLVSPCLMRWTAYVVIDRSEAAALVARVVDRSAATHVSGRTEHLAPVVPLIRRLHSARLATFVSHPYPFPVPDKVAENRLALRSDVGQLEHLFRHFGVGVERTNWQLRSSLRRLLRRHPIVVAERNGRIVAASVVNGITRHHMIADQVVVDAAHRGQGLMWTVGDRVTRIANAYGLAMCSVVYPTNPMSIDRYEHAEMGWTYAGLYERRLFRGHARLRELLFRFDALEQPDLTYYKEFPEVEVRQQAATTETDAIT